MKRARLGIGIALALLVISQAPLSVSQNPLSAYTKQLLDLIAVFHKLNQAIADQMKANERYLLAKTMLRLSSGFYGLMIAKQKFVKSIEKGPDNGTIDTSAYVPTVQRLQKAVECFSAQLTDKGARIGALTEIDGAAVEANLRMGLVEKVADLEQVAKELGLGGDLRNPQKLKASIITDANEAVEASRQLYLKTAEFAHVLDPTVIPPAHPEPCVSPPSAG